MLGDGRPLSPPERRPFLRWGDALTDVRVHDDRKAEFLAGLLGDKGYAAGNHVVLGDEGSHSEAPTWLLAHELAHVIQQDVTRGCVRTLDPEREADALADQVTGENQIATSMCLGSTSSHFAEKVVAKYTQNLPGDLLLVLDVDDGSFIGGCVRASVPHLGAKLIKKGVPKAEGNQVFDIHLGIIANPAGEKCFFFYESVSGRCVIKCYPTLDELKKRLGEIRDWIKDKVEQLLLVVLPVAAAVLLAYLIADAIMVALTTAGILALA